MRRWVWCFAAVAPLIVIAAFSHPEGDDFCYTARLIEHGFWGAQTLWRQEWSGRYVATFLITTFGWLTGLKANAAVVWFLMAGLLVGWIALARSVTAPRGWPVAFGIGVSAWALWLLLVPSSSQVLFWASGALTYQVGTLAMLGGLAFLLGRTHVAVKIVGASLCSLIAVGSNETAMALWVVTLVLGVAALRYRKSPQWWVWLCVALVALAGAAFSAAAPGNWSRAEHFEEGFRVVRAALRSSAHGLGTLARFLANASILAGTLWVWPWIKRVRQRAPLSGLPAWLAFAVFAALLVGAFFPAYFVRGRWVPHRIVSQGYLVCLLGWFGVVLPALAGVAAVSVRVDRWRRRFRPALGVVFVLGLFLQSNATLALWDLGTGAALTYHRQLREREAKLEAARDRGDVPVVVVEALERGPLTLHYRDIQAEPGHYRNVCVAEFYNLTSVRAVP